jgi:hypothetical protein
MVRNGIDLIALIYLATALICFIPYFQFGHPILVAAGLIYSTPSFLIVGGLVLRKGWGRKLAIILSPLLILGVLPLLFKKQLTFVFSIPSIAVTYSPTAALSFRGLFVGLIVGHLVSILYLLRGSVKGVFQRGIPAEEEKEGSEGLDPNARKEDAGG